MDTYRTANPGDWVLTDTSEFGYHRSPDSQSPTQLDRLAISLSPIFTAPPTDFTWINPQSGDWNSGNNWAPVSGPPGSANANSFTHHSAKFGDVITTPQTVFLNSGNSIRSIIFDNANTYAVAGTGSLSLVQSTASTPFPTSIAVVQCQHEFQLRVSLETDTAVDVASDQSLEFNNRLFLNDNTLTKTEAGSMAVNHQTITGGGTVICGEGTCNGTGTIGGDLMNEGGIISSGDSSGALAAVPEPATFVLLLVGVIGLTFLKPHYRPPSIFTGTHDGPIG